MRRWGVLASTFLIATVTGACAVTPAVQQEPPPGGDITRIVTEPVLRVAVVIDSPKVDVSSATVFFVTRPTSSVRDFTFQARDHVEFKAVEGGIELYSPSKKERVVREGPFIVQAAGDGPVSVGGLSYRGNLEIARNSRGKLTVIDRVRIEDYLRGVVPNEIGYKDPLLLEAVKAQAVAARTYAVTYRNQYPTEGYDLLSTVQDQVYSGVSGEAEPTDRAIRDTRGIIGTYDGQPIITNYASTCGGRTASRDEVWEKPPLPYLVGVSDAAENGTAWCATSKYFNWKESWDPADFISTVRRNLVREFGVSVDPEAVLNDVQVIDRGPSGRVKTLAIRTSRGEYRASGDRIRWVTQRPGGAGPLRSILFDVSVERSGGRAAQVIFTGHGWGHGVGMCQVGAMERSRHGQNFETILKHYYHGVELKPLY